MLDRGQVLTIDPEHGQGRVPRARKKAAATPGWPSRPTASGCWPRAFSGTIGVFEVDADGELEAVRADQAGRPGSKADPESILPVGLAIDRDGKTLWAVFNLRNSLAEIDLATGKIDREIPVGNAPFGVVSAGRQGLCDELGRAHARRQDRVTGPGRAAARRCASIRCGTSPPTARCRSSI